MLALAGYPLGISSVLLDRSANAPGAQIAPMIVGDWENPEKLEELAQRSDVVTFDWENISESALAPLENIVSVRPSRAALQISQDRLSEKGLFQRLKIPVTPHAPVDSKAQLQTAMRELGSPGILKTRRLGYDGKGQFVLRGAHSVDAAWHALGGVGLIYEKFQPFSREISIIGARSTAGRVVFYPLSSNTHGDGVLRYGIAPFSNARLERSARAYMSRVLNELAYVGVLAIEFFVVAGRLIANEMAPRVHNSGHWTIEGCVTSQFQNHMRAICDLPLGSTRALGHTAMVNFLGKMPDRGALLAIDGLAFHDYGKQARAGRKLGHCTIIRQHARERDQALRRALKLIEWR